MSNEKLVLDWCEVTLNEEDGSVIIRHELIGLAPRDLYHDEEDYREWSDDDLRGLAADLIGVEDDEVDMIEVHRV